ncbi:MAG: CHRD domain-containing protein [Nitrosospira sp.]
MKRWIFFVLLSLASFGANAALIHLNAFLDGAQEVPQSGQAAAGGSSFASMLFDDTTNVLSWTISYSLNTGPANAAHFHGATNPGDPSGVGIASPVRITIPDITGTSSGIVSNSFDLDALVNPADNAGNLLGGLWYINIHTSTFPSGEIRGQISVPEPATGALLGLGLAGLAFARRRAGRAR